MVPSPHSIVKLYPVPSVGIIICSFALVVLHVVMKGWKGAHPASPTSVIVRPLVEVRVSCPEIPAAALVAHPPY